MGGKAIFPIFAPAENTYPRDLPAITLDSFKTHLRARHRLADAAVSRAELAGDEAAKINRMTAFLAGGSMTGLLRARTRRPWRAAYI